jgi:hypothetical protein
MNLEVKKLNSFGLIYKNLREMESAYHDLEVFDIECDSGDYFEALLKLNGEIEKTIDVKKLTPSKLKKYKELNTGIYRRLRCDYPSLYSIAGNIEEFFGEAYEAAENSIEASMKLYEIEDAPPIAYGHANMHIFIPDYNLLGIMLNDGLYTPENYLHINGVMELNKLELNEKYGLTGQEYEIYADAYRACLDVIETKLKLEGNIQAYAR